MGWAKYYEDIIDAVTDSKFCKNGNYYITKIIDSPAFVCSYCNASFPSKNDIYAHIKKKHNVNSSSVLVNGKIVCDEYYIRELKSLIVIRYDLNETVFINQNQISDSKQSNEIDVTNEANEEFLKNKTVTIYIGDKKIGIHLISRDHIDNGKINSLISRWSEETKKGLHITKKDSSFNEIERRCVDGLYNYFIACVSTGKNKDKRYEDAYAILSETEDVLSAANVLLKVIAFKFNWTEKLRKLCVQNDIFANIYDFMVNKESAKVNDEDGELKIFIEDELEELIKSIIAYQKHEYNKVESYIKKHSSLYSISNIADYNQNDKINVLCARMAIIKSNKREARKYYNSIISPCFEEEKDNYIKTL